MSQPGPFPGKFLSSLARRGVFHVTGLYATGAWVLVQAASTVLAQEAVRYIWLGAAVAYPAVLAFGWRYDVTRSGVVRSGGPSEGGADQPLGRRDGLLIGALALFVVGVAAVTVQQVLRIQALEPLGPRDRIEAAAVPPESIVVLPLVSLADDAESAEFADGLSEELITHLATIPELRVTSRTSAFSFKGEALDVRAVGERLRVAHVLEGSVRRTGDRLRIVLRLIDARQDRQLWSDTYDRYLGDFFAVQNDIAVAVVGAMQVTLVSPLPVARETRADVFALYVRAKSLARGRSPEGLEQAERMLKQVLQIDPGFARAWNSLSVVYTDQADRGLMPRNEGYALARAADERAILADPGYAASYAGLAWISLSYDHDLGESARFLQRALELQPNNTAVLSDTAALLKTLGRLDEAIEIEEFNVLRDPLSPGRHNNLAASYFYAGRLEEAEEHFRRVLELSPKYSNGRMRLGMVLIARDRPQAALEIIEQEVNEAARLYGRTVAYHALEDGPKSDAALAGLLERYPKEVEHIAQAHAQRGEIDEAFEVLDSAYDRGEVALRDFRVDPRWAPLRSDSRWPAMLERAGVSDAQVAVVRLEVPVRR